MHFELCCWFHHWRSHPRRDVPSSRRAAGSGRWRRILRWSFPDHAPPASPSATGTLPRRSTRLEQECIPVGCATVAICLWGEGLPMGVSAWEVSARGVSTWGCLPGGVYLRCLSGGCLSGDVCQTPPPPAGQNDRHLWKHYLAAVADGNNTKTGTLYKIYRALKFV